MIMDGRCVAGANPIYSSYAHGSKGLAIVSARNDCDPPSRIYSGQNADRANMVWESKIKPEERNPYQNEWNTLIDAIRHNTPHNEAKRGAEASLVTSMGRMAAHTAQEITYDDILNCAHEFAPEVDKLTLDSAAPLLADADGRYPIPEPGVKKDREY
jgi:hypothetical protein